MNRFPRLSLPAGIYVAGLALYGVLVFLSGPDPHVSRSAALDTAALLVAWAMIVAVVIGVVRLVRDIDDAEGAASIIHSLPIDHELPKAA